MGKRKQYTGQVISDKMQKTRVVRVVRLSKHVKYGRVVKTHNKFKVHDEGNISKLGDTVRIEETRPLSKDKNFRLLKVIKSDSASRIQLKDEQQ